MTNIYKKAAEAGNAVAVISLEQIKENFKYLKKITFPAVCMPVFKADAYGLGADEIVKALLDDMQGCFVATVAEGVSIRHSTLKNVKKIDIFVLHGFLPNESEIVAKSSLIPVINTLNQALEWHKYYPEKPCALQIDSGMSRFGLSALEAQKEIFRSLNIKLILTHLACASDKKHPNNREQLETFLHITNHYFPDIPRSIAASEGSLFLGKDFHLEVVRAGIALYGNLEEAQTHPLKNAVSIRAPVFQISEYDSGKSFGYNNTWISKRKTVSATIGIGYADSCLSSRKKNQDIFLWKEDAAFPIIGRISMDSIIIDITDNAEMIRVGDFLELLGEHQPLASLAKSCEITPHEVLTSIGKRIIKEYISSDLA